MDKGNKGVLIYDINACPDECTGLTMDKIMQLFHQENLLLYDSRNGLEPTFIPIEDIKVNFVDLSKEEDMKKLNQYKTKLK